MDISKILEGVDVDGPAGSTGIARAVAELDAADVDELIQHALHPSVPVAVLFAALDRHTMLARLDGPKTDATREDPYLWPPPEAPTGTEADE